MQHLEVSRAVRPLKWSLGVKWLSKPKESGGPPYTTWRRKRPPEVHTDTSSPHKDCTRRKATHIISKKIRGDRPARSTRQRQFDKHQTISSRHPIKRQNTTKLHRKDGRTPMSSLRFYTDIYIITTYRICSRNLRTFFSILTAEKSGCVKYADFFLWKSWSGFYSRIIENTVLFLIFYCNFVTILIYQ